MRNALLPAYPVVAKFELTDYRVRILDQGHGTDATVRVLIQTTDGRRLWTTVGVGQNVVEASWEALATPTSTAYPLSVRPSEPAQRLDPADRNGVAANEVARVNTSRGSGRPGPAGHAGRPVRRYPTLRLTAERGRVVHERLRGDLEGVQVVEQEGADACRILVPSCRPWNRCASHDPVLGVAVTAKSRG